MNTCHKVFISIVFLAYAMHISPAGAIDDSKILPLICKAGTISGQTCVAKNYPNGENCELELSKSRAEGRFLNDGKNYLIVVYTSDCEPHASNWGGSVIFENDKGKLKFEGYFPGLVAQNCMTAKDSRNRDKLICETGWLGQGYLSTSISEIILSRAETHKIEFTFEDLIRAEDTTGARGTNTANCDQSGRTNIAVSNLTTGQNEGEIAFDLTFADISAVENACNKKDRNAKLGISPPLDNEAYLPDNDLTTARMRMNIKNKHLDYAD